MAIACGQKNVFWRRYKKSKEIGLFQTTLNQMKIVTSSYWALFKIWFDCEKKMGEARDVGDELIETKGIREIMTILRTETRFAFFQSI